MRVIIASSKRNGKAVSQSNFYYYRREVDIMEDYIFQIISLIIILEIVKTIKK